jgi:hypothetical protein
MLNLYVSTYDFIFYLSCLLLSNDFLWLWSHSDCTFVYFFCFVRVCVCVCIRLPYDLFVLVVALNPTHSLTHCCVPNTQLMLVCVTS